MLHAYCIKIQFLLDIMSNFLVVFCPEIESLFQNFLGGSLVARLLQHLIFYTEQLALLQCIRRFSLYHNFYEFAGDSP